MGGIAIVTAAADSSLYRMMSSDNMGILIQPENKDECVAAIIDNIYNDQNAEKSTNARGYAEKYLHQDNILLQYFKDFSFTHEQSPFVFVTPAVTMNQGELQ